MAQDLIRVGNRVHNILNPSRIGEVVECLSELKVRVKWEGDVSPRTESTRNLRPVDETDTTVDSWQARMQDGNYNRLDDIRTQMTSMYLDPGALDSYHQFDLPNVDHHDYQLLPLIRMLRSPHKGMLIADEVGLGKTIEAILVWREFQARYRYQRLLIISPAALQQKWIRELDHKFNINGEKLGAAQLLEQIIAPAFRSRPREIVTSLQGIRGRIEDRRPGDRVPPQEELMRYLESLRPGEKLFDLLIVDEAHYARNSKSQTHDALRLFANVSKRMLLLSATPVHTKSENLLTLLSLIDEAQFTSKDEIDLVIQGQRLVTTAALRLQRVDVGREESIEVLKNLRTNVLFSGSVLLDEAISDVSGADNLVQSKQRVTRALKSLSPIDEFITRTLKRDVQERHAERDPRDVTVETSELEQWLYALVHHTLCEVYEQRTDRRPSFAAILPLRQAASSFVAALRHWKRRAEESGGMEEVLDTDEQRMDAIALTPYQEATRRILLEVESQVSYEDLLSIDTKYRKLREILSRHVNEKVVVFTYFRETVSYLAERLRSEGVSVMTAVGGDDLNAIVTDYETSSAMVLIATDVASEGIDLQFAATVINYDLPWNPMVLEQRVGRIDRKGQKSKRLNIYHLVQTHTVEERIYRRIAERLRDSRQILGMIEPVVSNVIAEIPARLLQLRSLDTIDDDILSYDHELSDLRLQQMKEEVEAEKDLLQFTTQEDLERLRSISFIARPTSGADLCSYVEMFVVAWKGRNPEQSLVRVRRLDQWQLEVRLTEAIAVDYQAFCEAVGVYPDPQIELACVEPITFSFGSASQRSGSNVVYHIDSTSSFIGFIQHFVNKWYAQRTTVAVIRVTSEDVELPAGRYCYGVWNGRLCDSRETLVEAQPRFWVAALQSVDSGVSYEPQQAERAIIQALRCGFIAYSPDGSAVGELSRILDRFESGALFDAWDAERSRIESELRERVDRRLRYEYERRAKLDSRISDYRARLSVLNALALAKYEKHYESDMHDSNMNLERLKREAERRITDWLLTVGIMEVQ